MTGGARTCAVALSAVGLLTGLALVETTLRLGYTAEQFQSAFGVRDGQSHIIGHPFLPFAGRPSHSYRQFMGEIADFIQVDFNAHGFRTPNFDEPPSDADFVIVCLGGSTTFGYAARSNADTWPAQLERMLQKEYRHRRIRVFNLGFEGATLPYSLVNLALNGVHLRPDLVIVYHGFNDYGPITSSSFRTDYAHHYIDVPRGDAGSWQRSLAPWMTQARTLVAATHALDRIVGANSLASQGQRAFGPPEHDVDAALDRMGLYLDLIADLARSVDAKLLISTFQFKSGGVQSEQVNGALRRYSATRGIALADQDLRLRDNDDTLQMDECHFTHLGREQIAQGFFERIVAEGLVQ